MHDSVHTAMHEDSALSAIDSEILHGSRLAGATLTSQLHQGSVKNPQAAFPLELTYERSYIKMKPLDRIRNGFVHGDPFSFLCRMRR